MRYPSNSSPSTLKITDMRFAILVKPGPSPCDQIRVALPCGRVESQRRLRHV